MNMIRRACWWLANWVPLGPLGPWVTGVAMWRWPRKQKTSIEPNPFSVEDVDCVVVTGTDRHDGVWVQCRKCKSGFPAFGDYKQFLSLVQETLPATEEKGATSLIGVRCPNCNRENHYWLYNQPVKDMRERD